MCYGTYGPRASKIICRQVIMVDFAELMKRPVDMEHYFKNKERLDRDIQAAMEAGTAEQMGIPPGFPAESFIKQAVIACDKYPALGRADDDNKKPLTASQKRRARRDRQFTRDAEPDEVLDYEMVEAEDKIENDRQFKVVSKEDWVAPPNVQYKKDGKDMPKDFVPFAALPDGPLPDKAAPEPIAA